MEWRGLAGPGRSRTPPGGACAPPFCSGESCFCSIRSNLRVDLHPMFTRDELLREALSLQPLPASSTRLTQILASDDWTLREVAQTAQLDEVLTGLLLRYVNSAANAGQDRITSVSQAVMRVGPNVVLSLSLGQAVSAPMKTDLPAYDMGEGELFRHSVSTALAIENFRRAGKESPAGTFVAALVHDIGKLVIGRKLRSMGITLTSGDKDTPWVNDEAEQLGINHAELGGAIARAWELPAGVPEAIEHHHNPHELEPGVAKTIAQFIAAADFVAHSLDREENEEEVWDPIATTHIGLAPDAQRKVREGTKTLVEGVLRLYS